MIVIKFLKFCGAVKLYMGCVEILEILKIVIFIFLALLTTRIFFLNIVAIFTHTFLFI